MKYDVAILGGGPGGYVAAVEAARMGGRVLLIEKENLGGVCLNKGCIPTKTLLKCSSLYESIKRSHDFGINVGSVSADFPRIMERKREVVGRLAGGIKDLMKANKIDVVMGEGHLTGPGVITANDATYEADNIIIATGSKPFLPGIKGIDSERVLDSDGMLAMEDLPQSAVIIGGGVIGVEFATFLSGLGCSVTIVEMMDEILSTADQDVIRELGRMLRRSKIDVITSAKVLEIKGSEVVYEKAGAISSVNGEKILAAVGRIPNVNTAELDSLGVIHDRGRIRTDEFMRTNMKGIYAIGDVNGKYMLAHVASEEGIVAVHNIFGHKKRMDYGKVPQCVYLHPEIAWVGMTEREAAGKGIEYEIRRSQVGANGRALAEGEASGFVKVVVGKLYGEILGVHMVCPHATEMISEGILAMSMEATANWAAGVMHPHPTVSEVLGEAFKTGKARQDMIL